MSKFNRRGKTKVYFVPTLASTTSPSAATVLAATYLGKALREMTGFETAQSRISEAVLESTINPQINGEQTFGDASMVLLEDDGTTTDPDYSDMVAAYTALADGAAGYIVVVPTGVAAASKKCDVWPVSVGSRNRLVTTDNEFAKYRVNFAVLSAPSKDATLAA